MNNISLAQKLAFQTEQLLGSIANNPSMAVRSITVEKNITNDQGGSQTSDKSIQSRLVRIARELSEIRLSLQQEHYSSGSDKAPYLADPILPSNDNSRNNQGINQAEQTALDVETQSQELITLDEVPGLETFDVLLGSMQGPEDPPLTVGNNEDNDETVDKYFASPVKVDSFLTLLGNDELNVSTSVANAESLKGETTREQDALSLTSVIDHHGAAEALDDGVTGKQFGISAEPVSYTWEASTKVLAGDDQETVAEAGLSKSASLCPSPGSSRKRALNELKSPGCGSGTEAEGDESSQKMRKLGTNLVKLLNPSFTHKPPRATRTAIRAATAERNRRNKEKTVINSIKGSLQHLGLTKENDSKKQVLFDALNMIRAGWGLEAAVLPSSSNLPRSRVKGRSKNASLIEASRKRRKDDGFIFTELKKALRCEENSSKREILEKLDATLVALTTAKQEK